MHEQEQFAQTTEGKSAVLKVRGEVDLSNKAQFRGALARGLAAAGDRLVVELQHVSYMDSTGIVCLIRIANEANDAQKRLLLVVDENGYLWKLFEITGLSRLCTVNTQSSIASAITEAR